MYIILTLLFILSAILSIIFYGAMQEVLLPKFLASRHAARLSRVIYRLMIEIRNDWIAHLQTMCEHDGDEPFEPFLDSPLHTCPPTEFCLSPPKEETGTDGNNNPGNGVPPRRRRPRVVLPIHQPNAPVPPLRLPAQQRVPNPAVVVHRIANIGVRQRPLVREIERLGVDVDRQINEVNQIAIGVRRVLQLRQFQLGVLSPPPQENEEERFQFD